MIKKYATAPEGAKFIDAKGKGMEGYKFTIQVSTLTVQNVVFVFKYVLQK
jgi:hypothetical protein